MLSDSVAIQKLSEDWESGFSFKGGEQLKHLASHLTKAMEVLQTSTWASEVVDVLRRIWNLVVCHVLQFTYLWYSVWGPDFVEAVFAVYGAGGQEKVAEHWSADVASFVSSIMTWLESVNSARQNGDQEPLLCLLPNIYGFREANTDGQNVMFALKDFDTSLNGNCTKSDKPSDVRARCIAQWALLDCLVDWLDDDSIFAALNIRAILLHPLPLLSLPGHTRLNYDKLTENILSGKNAGLERLEFYFWQEHNAGEVQDSLISLAQLVQRTVTGLADLDSRPGKAGRSIRSPRKKAMFWKSLEGCAHVSPEMPLATLCPWQDGFQVQKLACIIWETLWWKRGQPAGRIELRRILEAKHPTLNQNLVGTSDYYNPIRSSNSFHTLLKLSLGDHDLRSSDYGLSNILVRIGTGQGKVTETFVKKYLCNKHFTSATECIKALKCLNYGITTTHQTDNVMTLERIKQNHDQCISVLDQNLVQAVMRVVLRCRNRL
ncbi:hypothetical protein K435DRAFT_870007 [Dendrothele bispora CBS 962.96]|uniref:Uncharacterized protein n=1 Tax=Dendrothele bispora (strain CBS 962.96) TaxID=1314807 RepID=A0A4S8L839_DENBC|nr:hypothetical protein K435DRAFT_870007 [Dendrothele bispora CBS 962.96]